MREDIFKGFEYWEPDYIKDIDYKYIGKNIETNIEILDYKPISEEAKNALIYILENDEKIYNNMHKKFCEDFKALRKQYGYEVKELDEVMPELRNVEVMMQHVKVRRIHIMDKNRDGYAYVGFECDCTWEVEHAFGFMTYKDRLLEIGHGDTSFDIYACE